MKIGRIDPQSAFFQPGVFRLFLTMPVMLQHTSHVGIGKWALFSFFVLSGYWVARMYEERYLFGRLPAITFAVSRYFRMLPIFVLCVALNAATLLAIGKDAGMVRTAIQSPLWILRNFLIVGSSYQPVFLTPIWSLDIEMQFYLIAPLVLVLVKRLGSTIDWLLVPLLAWTAWIVPQWNAANAGCIYHYLGLFVLGVAMYYRKYRVPANAGVASLFAVGIVFLVLLLHPTWHWLIWGGRVWHPLYLWCANFSVVVTALTFPYLAFHVSNRSSRLDRHVSNATYAIFLFHFTPATVLVHYARELSLGGLLAGEAAVWVLSYAGGAAIYWWLDRPIEQARARLFDRLDLGVPVKPTPAPVLEAQGA